jgi:hypothetical protein
MPRRYPPEVRRQVIELARSGKLETELAVSRKVNEIFLEQGLPPKGSTR